MATVARRIIPSAYMQVRFQVISGSTSRRISSLHNPYHACLSTTSTRHVTSLVPHERPARLSKLPICSKNSYQQLFFRLSSSDATPVEEDLNVPYESLVKHIDSGDIQLIDVREPHELAQFGQITNSIHIPLGELSDALNLPEDKFKVKYNHPKPQTSDDNIVFHCRSGVRSLNAINIAKEVGYAKARHFKGGWLQWAEKNNLPSA